MDQAVQHCGDAKLALAAPPASGSSRDAPAAADTSLPAGCRGWPASTCAASRPSGRCPVRPRPPRLCWPAPASRPAEGPLASGPRPAAPRLCRSCAAAGARLRRDRSSGRLHPLASPIARTLPASDAEPCSSSEELHSLSFGPSFAPRRSLLRPLLTSRSGSTPSPFRRKARSPQVRTHSFTARPPDLRCLPSVTRASQFVARSPWSAPPHIRFLSICPQFRSTLPPHGRSPFRSCASLRSL